MGSYEFVVGDVLMIGLFAMMLGPMGMAEDLYGDEFKVVDSQADDFDEDEDYDFDIDRLRLIQEDDDTFEEMTEPQTLTRYSLVEGEDNGQIIFQNVSDDVDENDTLRFRFNDGRFTTHSRILLYDADGNELDDIPVSGSAKIVDITEDYKDVDEIIVLLEDENYSFIDLEGPLDIDEDVDATDSNIEEDQLELEEGAYDKVNATLRIATQALSNAPGMLVAWISFFFAIPGDLGTMFVFYITGFTVYFLVTEIWI